MQARWRDLRNDDLQVAEGNTDLLVGTGRERYRWDRDRATNQASDFERSVRTDRSI